MRHVVEARRPVKERRERAQLRAADWQVNDMIADVRTELFDLVKCF